MAATQTAKYTHQLFEPEGDLHCGYAQYMFDVQIVGTGTRVPED
jgi:hypothetical protein